MTEHRTFTPDFAAFVSWADRLAHFRTTDHLGGCLLSIRDEARRAECLDWYLAAQGGLDTGGDLTALDELIAAEDEAERQHERAYRYECRTGKLWDDLGIEPAQLLKERGL